MREKQQVRVRLNGVKDVKERRATYDNGPIVNRVSTMPVLFMRARRTSVSDGMYSCPANRCTSVKKLACDVASLAKVERRSNRVEVTH